MDDEGVATRAEACEGKARRERQRQNVERRAEGDEDERGMVSRKGGGVRERRRRRSRGRVEEDRPSCRGSSSWGNVGKGLGGSREGERPMYRDYALGSSAFLTSCTAGILPEWSDVHLRSIGTVSESQQ
jgi:hypothetical protein